MLISVWQIVWANDYPVLHSASVAVVGRDLLAVHLNAGLPVVGPFEGGDRETAGAGDREGGLD